MYKKGDIVKISNQIDPAIKTVGTIQLVEPDDDVLGLSWLYIRSNNEKDNIQYDERIGNFWCIIESLSERIELIWEA